jgi:hypothetical protein
MNERDGPEKLRNRLFALLKERAFRRGRVVLASGRESDFYFDMKPAMLDPDGVVLMVELILQQIHGVKADCVGGLEMGAVPLIAPVAMRSLDFGRRLPGFFVRKAVKDHGTKKRVDGADIAGKPSSSSRTATGGSAMDRSRLWKNGRDGRSSSIDAARASASRRPAFVISLFAPSFPRGRPRLGRWR